LLHSARSGPTTAYRAPREKHPMDQWSNESSAPGVRFGRAQILRKFGEPPKIRRLLFLGRVPTPAPLVCHLTDLSDVSKRLCGACHLARFLRGGRRGSCSPVADERSDLDRSHRGSWLLRNPRRCNHEACNHRTIVGGRLRRPEYCGRKRRRLRSRCISGRLRWRRWCRGRSTPRRRRTASRRPPQSVLTLGRRVSPRTSCRTPQDVLCKLVTSELSEPLRIIGGLESAGRAASRVEFRYSTDPSETFYRAYDAPTLANGLTPYGRPAAGDLLRYMLSLHAFIRGGFVRAAFKRTGERARRSRRHNGKQRPAVA
jgi:hypothetical protein